jgi:prophage antirepressor-like protein
MELTTFKNNEFGAVRVLRDENGEPWFIAKDVCDVLGLADVSMSLKKLDEDEKLIQKLFVSGQYRNVWLINESGLYSLILRSNKPEAKKFRKWVTSEVLPAIRKHGMYATAETLQKMLADPRNAIKILEAYTKEQEKRKDLEAKVNLLTHTGKTYTTTEIAKELEFRSAIELNKRLEEKGIQYKVNGTWVLSAKYADLGYESIKQKTLPNGKTIYDRRWTQKGREFLLELFSKDNSTKKPDLPANNNQLPNSTQAG